MEGVGGLSSEVSPGASLSRRRLCVGEVQADRPRDAVSAVGAAGLH